MTDLPATLTGLQDAIQRGRLTPREAIAAQRERFARLDRQLHCVIEPLGEAAEDAEPPSGPLAGIGLAHKDIFDTHDRRPGCGHDLGRSEPGLRPAPVLARLRERGASHLGALAMAEFACGATGDNPRFERCVNPLRAEAVVGGSSSGSAVAVASGMAYGSLGTDTGGSVRIPAATCGLVGLKTTQGLIPDEGAQPLAPSLDTIGILARAAGDALQLLDAVAPAGRLRAAATRAPRVGAWIPEDALQAEVADALHAFADASAADPLPNACAAHVTLTQLAEIVMHGEAASTHRTALLAGTASAAVQAVALAGLAIPRAWQRAALADRASRVREFVEAHFAAHDLLILPALPNPIPDWRVVTPGMPEFDARQLLALHRYMGFINYLGLPSLVMPIARDRRGLPISAQVLARPFHERSLLAFAAAAESRPLGADALPDALH